MWMYWFNCKLLDLCSYLFSVVGGHKMVSPRQCYVNLIGHFCCHRSILFLEGILALPSTVIDDGG